MGNYDEILKNLALSEYLLSLSGDAEYQSLLTEKRDALKTMIAEAGDDYAFLCAVMDGVYTTFETSSGGRALTCDQFIDECTALGFTDPGIVIDMGDAIYEMRTDEKHARFDAVAEPSLALTGVYKAAAILFWQSVLRICVGAPGLRADTALLKRMIEGVRAYSKDEVNRYGSVRLTFMQQ